MKTAPQAQGETGPAARASVADRLRRPHGAATRGKRRACPGVVALAGPLALARRKTPITLMHRMPTPQRAGRVQGLPDTPVAGLAAGNAEFRKIAGAADAA